MSVGVLVAMRAGVTAEHAINIVDYLERRFPGVTFAVVDGGMSSIAFDFQRPVGPDAPTVILEPESMR